MYSVYCERKLNVKVAGNQCDVTPIKTENVLKLNLCKNFKKIKVNFINSLPTRSNILNNKRLKDFYYFAALPLMVKLERFNSF